MYKIFSESLINDVVYEINNVGLNKNKLDEIFTKVNYHVVIMSLEGLKLYDNFAEDTRDHFDNPAVQNAIKNNWCGEYAGGNNYYFAVHNDLNVVLIYDEMLKK